MISSNVAAFIALSASLTFGVQAQTQNSGPPSTKPASATAGPRALATAEVVEVYLKEKRILLKHGPIPNLGMSAMTMEFAVRNPKVLTSLRPGSNIKFTAEQVHEDYVVTFIEFAK